MIQICFSVFCIFLEINGYGGANKSVFLYSVRAITEKERIENMGNMTGNCTYTKKALQ